MSTLTARERRLVAIALLVALIAGLWYGIANPILGGFAARAEARERLVEERGRQLRLMGSAGVWRQQAERQRQTMELFALRAPTAEAAAEAAQQRITAAIAAGGATVKSLHEEAGSPGRVRLRAELQLNLAQLSATLRRLEAQKPYIIIEKLTVAADETTEAAKPAPLDASVDLAIPYVLAPA
jgi:general secretion pathway protein M